MIKYQYKALNKTGQAFSDFMVAESHNVVAEKLKVLGYTVIFIKKVQLDTNVSEFLFKRFNRIKLSELNLFTRQFAVLQRAGVNILLSLNSLSDQTENKKLKDIIAGIVVEIKAGKSFSVALENYPDIFSPLYINMIKAGEESGTLVGVFERLAELGEYEEKVNRSIIAATRYPIIVICSIIVAFIILITMVVPRFVSIYSSAGTDLPIPTLILIWINNAVIHYWWLLIGLIAAVYFAIHKYINTKKGRFQWDSLKLKIPIVGPLITKIIMGRFAKIAGSMLHAGVPILRILDFVYAGVGNVIIAQAIERIKTEVQEGNKMSGAMKVTGLFPPVVIQMIAVGEDTGRLDELLGHVSDYYEGEVRFTVENLTTLIEPILLFILSCGVLLMALGIFMPMWNMMNLFRK